MDAEGINLSSLNVLVNTENAFILNKSNNECLILCMLKYYLCVQKKKTSRRGKKVAGEIKGAAGEGAVEKGAVGEGTAGEGAT